MDKQLDLRNVPFIFATATWLAMHRVAVNRGFKIRRGGLSTDTLFAVLISCSATVWTAVVLITGAATTDSSIRGFLSRAAHAPLLIQGLSIVWLILWIDTKWAEKYRHGDAFLWKLSVTSGPCNWSKSVNPILFWAFAAITAISVLCSSISVILEGRTLQGVLNIIGISVFFLSGTGMNPYTGTVHQYSADMLRIVLPTSHHEGTVYILPSKGHGFDASWCPKIQNEHIEADTQAMSLFASIRAGKWSLKTPLERVRHVVASYQERVDMSASELESLARWLYLDDSEQNPNMRPIRCLRAEGTHLIGRDLMYALCHAEYLVFMGQGKLPLEQQRKIGFLRLLKRSGATLPLEPTFPSTCIGFKPGMSGYRDAVQYIYRLFDEPLDENALRFTVPPPKYSCTLGYSPSSIEEYVDGLWTVCCQHSESTFTALYMFTLVWSIEEGNCNGFHLFPLRCRNRRGDVVSWQLVWRQAWYEGVICQLISSSLLMFTAFVMGYLE